MQPATINAAPRFTVKASLGSDVRRFNLENAEFPVLKETCIRVFALPPASSPAFKYTDDENDVVTISSSAELAEAFRVHSDLLRIAVDVTPTVVPAPVIAAKPRAKHVLVKPVAAVKQPVVIPCAAIAVAPVACAPAAPTATAAAASAAAAPTAATAPAAAPSAAVPAPAPIHSTADATPIAPAADDAEIQSARAELIDIRTRFQNATDKREKAQLRQQLMAAKGRVVALHVAAKSHKAALQIQRKQAAKKQEKKAVDKADAASPAPAAKPLKEQMLLARFVRDVTIPDGFEMDGGRAFVKTWRFRNDSPRGWTTGSRLLFVGKNSDRMGALDSLPVAAVLQPGDECDISVSLVSPNEPGRYTAYFRLADAAGRKFGQRVCVQIHVTADSCSESEKDAAHVSASPIAPSAPDAPKKKEKKAFEPSADELAKYGVHLRTLGSMGFLNTKRNLRLLNRFAGNLDRTVEILLRKPEKNKPQATA